MRTAKAKKITVSLSVEESARLSSHPSYPRKQWGENKVDAFHHEVFLEGLNSPKYRIKELEYQLNHAEARVKAAQLNSDYWRDYWMKKAKPVK